MSICLTFPVYKLKWKCKTNRHQNSNLLFLQQHDQSQKFRVESNLLKINKNQGIDIYYIGYSTIKKIGDCENINSVNPLYLLVNYVSRYTEEKNGNKYLTFDDSVNENKGLLKKYADVWDRIKNEI